MMDWISIIIYVIIVLIVVNLMKGVASNKPPGPRAWPLVGNLPQILGKSLHIAFTEMSKLYGDLVWLRMGPVNVLVINSAKMAMVSFIKQGRVFAGRPKKTRSVEVLLGDGMDICMNDLGPELKFHRKIVHSFLAAQNTFGKDRMEKILIKETQSLVDAFGEFADRGEAMDPKLHVARVVANVLSQVVMSRRFDRVDSEFHEQLAIVKDIVDNIESFNIVDVIPWLEHFPIPSWKRFKTSIRNRDRWIGQLIREHRERGNERIQSVDENKDLVDTLLELQTKAREEGDAESLRMLDDLTIGIIVHELFGGGIESTTMTILWLMVFLLHHPEGQDRIAEEVRSISNPDDDVTMFSRHSLPYLDAAIKETLRLASVLPIGFPHRTVSDTELSGYQIPKDTMVILNIWAIHHDESIWEDPFAFKPERFLNMSRQQRQSYIPFGIGQRVCLGANVAKIEVLQYCAYVFSKFKLKVPDTDSLPDKQGCSGMTIRPNPFRVQVIRR